MYGIIAIQTALTFHIQHESLKPHQQRNGVYLTISPLMSYIYGAPSKARNLTSRIYIYMDEIFYWGFCFLSHAFISLIYA
jgi:hypothetical protein